MHRSAAAAFEWYGPSYVAYSGSNLAPQIDVQLTLSVFDHSRVTHPPPNNSSSADKVCDPMDFFNFYLPTTFSEDFGNNIEIGNLPRLGSRDCGREFGAH